MAENIGSMLTETAFVLPGTQLKIPRWAILAVLGGVIVIVLIAKKQGATIGTTEEDTGDETPAGGTDFGSFLEKLMEELNNWQGPVAPPAPLEDGGYIYTPAEPVTTTGPSVPASVWDPIAAQAERFLSPASQAFLQSEHVVPATTVAEPIWAPYGPIPTSGPPGGVTTYQEPAKSKQAPATTQIASAATLAAVKTSYGG